MTWDQFVIMVNQVGFPIFVAAYMILRMDKLMSRISNTLQELVDIHRNHGS